MADLTVTLIKSPIGNRPNARATVLAMGLRRLHQSVVIPDNHSTRGMIASVSHLVRVEAGSQQVCATRREKQSIGVTKVREDSHASKPVLAEQDVPPAVAADDKVEGVAT